MVVGASEYLSLCDFPGVAHGSSSLDRFDDVLASYLSGPHVFGLASFGFSPPFFSVFFQEHLSSVRNWHKILSCRIELSRAVVNGYTSHMVHMAIGLKVNFHLPTVR